MLRRAAGRDGDSTPPPSSTVADEHQHIRHASLRHRQHQRQHHQRQRLVGLGQRVVMFVRYLVASRSIYTQLPDMFCSSEARSAGHYDVCWNGTAVAAYVRYAL